jgi:hypothetical protein
LGKNTLNQPDGKIWIRNRNGFSGFTRNWFWGVINGNCATADCLAMDFGAAVGTTITDGTLIRIDSVLLNDNIYHRKFHLNNAVWIEGVGMESKMFLSSERLNCFATPNGLTYGNGCNVAFPCFQNTDKQLENNTLEVMIYPNPVAQKIQYSLSNGSADKIELYNEIGQLVLSPSLGTNTNKGEISVQGLSNGVYIMVLYSQGSILRKKISIFN